MGHTYNRRSTVEKATEKKIHFFGFDFRSKLEDKGNGKTEQKKKKKRFPGVLSIKSLMRIM